jgi:hypothetical protein
MIIRFRGYIIGIKLAVLEGILDALIANIEAAGGQMLSAVEELQGCGHPRAAIVCSDGGTCYCRMCEEEAREVGQ